MYGMYYGYTLQKLRETKDEPKAKTKLVVSSASYGTYTEEYLSAESAKTAKLAKTNKLKNNEEDNIIYSIQNPLWQGTLATMPVDN